MSSRELERVGVMGRVDSGAVKLKDAAATLELSYRQGKRSWRRYRQVVGKGLQHGNAGRPSNRSKPLKLFSLGHPGRRSIAAGLPEMRAAIRHVKKGEPRRAQARAQQAAANLLKSA